MISFVIDGQPVEGKEGSNVLAVALDAGIEIPHLCYNESVKPYGACRLCLVEVVARGRSRMTASCTYPVLPGIEVHTHTEKVLRARRMVMELLLAMCPGTNGFRTWRRKWGSRRFASRKRIRTASSAAFAQGSVTKWSGPMPIQFYSRGDRREMGAPFAGEAMDCIACGACVVVCPVNVIGMEEKAEERTINRWKRTLKMKQCKVCGNSFAPWFQVEKFREKANLPKDFFDVCYTCRS